MLHDFRTAAKELNDRLISSQGKRGGLSTDFHVAPFSGKGLAVVGLLLLVAAGCRTVCPPATRGDTQLAPVPGPEDFEIQVSGREAPRLLVSSQDRAGGETNKQPGSIKAIPLGKGAEKATPIEFVGRDNCSFHPHGISLVTAPSGRSLLYVINHHDLSDVDQCLQGQTVAIYGDRVNSVEIYELSEDGAWRPYGKRLLDPILTNPNDLAALPDGRIYLTNAPVNRTLGILFEGLIGHSSSSVAVFDGQRWHRIAFKPRIANGIAVDGARGRLYVAESGRRKINVFAIDGPYRSTSPEKVEEIFVGSTVDNLSWGPEGPEGRTLWVAAYPSSLAFAKLGRAWKRHRPKRPPLSPSEVFSVQLSGNSGDVRCVFYDDGRRISGASTAFPFEGSLLLGQVFDQFILRDPAPYSTCGCPDSKEGQ